MNVNIYIYIYIYIVDVLLKKRILMRHGDNGVRHGTDSQCQLAPSSYDGQW